MGLLGPLVQLQQQLNLERICKICGLLKPLSNFYYNITSQCYSRTCSNCTNEGRRKQRKRKCEKCGIEKLANRDNFPRTAEGTARVCKECIGEIKKDRTTYRNKSGRLQSRAKIILYRCRGVDTYKNRSFSLSLEFIEIILGKPCIYCGFPSTGLDRIDNALGHTEENCVPCCKECNIARNKNFSHSEMLLMGKVIRQIKLNRV